MTDGSTPAAATVTVVRDLMSRQVVTAPPDCPLSAAAAKMVQAGVGSVVVLQGSFLAGILTERDVLRAAASGQDLSVSQVSDWMTHDPHATSPDTSADDAAQMMFLHGFRHLPVAQDHQVCGVVSLRDLFAARIRRK